MIEIKNLDFSYKKTPVFSNINLSFVDEGGYADNINKSRGAIYGLLGENGVGKTTLLKLICGLQRPSEGTCTVDGMTSHDRLPEMLQSIVFMPDEVTLPDGATPQQYVNELAPFYPNFSQGKFLQLMQEVEVEPERKFREMSFGQQKKSLIAASLSLGTDYILLDEPTNGLDIPSKAQFRSILSKIADEGKIIVDKDHPITYSVTGYDIVVKQKDMMRSEISAYKVNSDGSQTLLDDMFYVTGYSDNGRNDGPSDSDQVRIEGFFKVSYTNVPGQNGNAESRAARLATRQSPGNSTATTRWSSAASSRWQAAGV